MRLGSLLSIGILVAGLSLFSSNANASTKFLLNSYSGKTPSSVQKFEKKFKSKANSYIVLTRSCSLKNETIGGIVAKLGSPSTCTSGKIVTARSRGRQSCSSAPTSPRCVCVDTAALCLNR